jgi:hypothetical protein
MEGFCIITFIYFRNNSFMKNSEIASVHLQVCSASLLILQILIHHQMVFGHFTLIVIYRKVFVSNDVIMIVKMSQQNVNLLKKET